MDKDLQSVLLAGKIIPDLATPAQIAMADRMLQIHSNDPKKAGEAFKLWAQRQQ